MAERHLYRIINKTRLKIAFELSSPVIPSNQGHPVILDPEKIATPPAGAGHWTIPAIGSKHGVDSHPCVLSSTDAAGNLVFRFTLAVETDAFSGEPRNWVHGGFSIWTGKPVVATCPDAMRILEPFPPFPADAPESIGIELLLTGQEADGSDLRVDALTFNGAGHAADQHGASAPTAG